MTQIEVDFDVYKALTSRRASESVTYNDVIRDLLELEVAAAGLPATNGSSEGGFKGVVYKGVAFPDGTRFRATYKGKVYIEEIKNGVWVDGEGKSQNSPSQAAYNITGSGINGWRFWECSRPFSPAWVLIDNLR